MKVLINIPDKNLQHEYHCRSNLRDYIKSALAEMGGCRDPIDYPYFDGLNDITVVFDPVVMSKKETP